MPEKENDRIIFTLLEVTKSIQKTLSERYKSSFWVKAEMNKLNLYPSSGHCYPDLVEKKDGKVIAEIMANIWKDDFQRINTNFLNVLKEPLKSGINILFCAKITYTPENGLRLRIIDIDPSYSLGNLEKEKQETISKLKLEGVYNANKTLQLPLLPQRIAIISVQTSKGYSDFMQIIGTNPWGYKFFMMLFPALLQGDRAAETIMSQLARIKKVIGHFDAVAIIRGGGGDVGLTCYNNYELSKSIAMFPIPVITGIGHSTNETVSEMIAYKNAITPTELADFLLQKFHNFSVPVQKGQETIVDKTRRFLKDENLRLFNSVRYLKSISGNMLIRSENELQNKLRSLIRLSDYLIQKNRDAQVSMLRDLRRSSIQFIGNAKKSVENVEKHIGLMDPVNVLKRGYSITFINGKILQKVESVREGDSLKTVVSDGEIVSIAKQINKTE